MATMTSMTATIETLRRVILLATGFRNRTKREETIRTVKPIHTKETMSSTKERASTIFAAVDSTSERGDGSGVMSYSSSSIDI